MTTDVIDQYTLLHLIKVKGFASAESIAAGVGAPTEAVEPLLRQYVEGELVKLRTGRLSGYTLTATGRARHSDLRSGAVDPAATAKFRQAYDAFLEPNRAFKQLTTEWQLREPDSDPAPLLARLTELHAAVSTVTSTAAEAEPRFTHYETRFANALGRLQSGDDSAFARPMSDSYHDVWMELHEDIISSLDQERTEADE